MSTETIVFLIGAVLTALTIYGAVMAAGLHLTGRQIEESPRLGDDVDDEELDKTLPLDVKY